MSAAGGAAVNLVEVFSSVQGEGPDVGRSTLFVRLGGCDLRCRWCDSPGTWRPVNRGRVETSRGSGVFEEHANPVRASEVLALAEPLEPAQHAMVSLTGGEPLLQPDAVAALATGFRALGPEILLETHGLRADELSRVVTRIDVVSMDWKLASDVRRESDPREVEPAPFHEEHEAFLAVARRAPRVVVKIVITQETRDEEVDEAVLRVARTHPEAVLVLQPVTPFGGVRERPGAARLLGLARRAERRHARVRLVPQTHPVLGAL